ncbi:unnamed protein product [Ilex paraguariensis]|uniref:Uncharacterized protein n=1 Tax=Ilex paraguariensis TaxID=185542 RepID=A0ABC8QYJ0_9AQUA
MLKKKSKASGFTPDLSAQRSMSSERKEMLGALNVDGESRSGGVIDVDAREVNIGKTMGVGEERIQAGQDGTEREATWTSGTEGIEGEVSWTPRAGGLADRRVLLGDERKQWNLQVVSLG